MLPPPPLLLLLLLLLSPVALRVHICLPELVSLFAFIGRPPL
jgi:hypothetical protein